MSCFFTMLRAKNYSSRPVFHGVIHKITLAQFFLRHGVVICITESSHCESVDKYHTVLQSVRPGTTYGGSALSSRRCRVQHRQKPSSRQTVRRTLSAHYCRSRRRTGPAAYVCAVVETRLKYVRVQETGGSLLPAALAS